MNHHRRAHRCISMIRKVIRRAEDGHRSVAEELIDVATGVDDGGHDDLEQSVEAGDGVLGGVRLGEWGEVTNVDEQYGHLATLSSEDIVALLEQSRRQRRVD